MAAVLGPLGRFAQRNGRLRVAVGVGAVIAVVLAGHLVALQQHRAQWARSWTKQRQIIQNQDFGVPIMGGPADVRSLVRFQYDRPTLNGYSVFADTGTECTARGLLLNGNGLTGVFVSYGGAIAVDVEGVRALPLRDQQSCMEAVESFPRGTVWPVEAQA